MDTDWAYVRQNIGPTLYGDFGLQGLFVVNDMDRTVYSVINGQLQPTQVSSWLGQSLASVLSQARAGAEAEETVTKLINIDGQPAVVAAAAITPGTDPTVQPDGRLPSVLIFVRVLDPDGLEELGKEYGIEGLRIATVSQHRPIIALGENGAAGSLHWNPERPGRRLLGVGFSVLGITALLVCLLAWGLWRRTTASAKALDASYLSLQRSQDALAISEARFRDIVEISSDWIWEIDSQWRFTYLSERFEVVTGLPRGAWMGTSIDEVMSTEHGTLSQWLSLASYRSENSLHCRYVGSSGQEHVTRVSARATRDQGFRGTSTDVTGEVEARRQIEFLSQHDALTGLANRTRLQNFLNGKLKATPTREQPLVSSGP